MRIVVRMSVVRVQRASGRIVPSLYKMRSGRTSEYVVNANLVGAERAPALQDENGLAESGHFCCESGHAHFLSNVGRRFGWVLVIGCSPVISRALRW